jgi:hypothetical protein
MEPTKNSCWERCRPVRERKSIKRYNKVDTVLSKLKFAEKWRDNIVTSYLIWGKTCRDRTKCGGKNNHVTSLTEKKKPLCLFWQPGRKDTVNRHPAKNSDYGWDGDWLHLFAQSFYNCKPIPLLGSVTHSYLLTPWNWTDAYDLASGHNSTRFRSHLIRKKKSYQTILQPVGVGKFEIVKGTHSWMRESSHRAA